MLAVGRGVFELTGYRESDLIGQDVATALSFSDTEPLELVREWGVRRLGQELELKTRAGLRKPVLVDLFPAYDEDGGILVALYDPLTDEMAEPTSEIWLVRHGQTSWSRDWLHTSVTDVPLTEQGVEQAQALADRLDGRAFALVLTSPRSRARRTAELAGFPDAVVDDDLAEWDYGRYEGVSTATIRETDPGWSVWTHVTPGGESADEVGARTDRVLARARAADGDVLLFGHAHALRVLAARWLGLPPEEGRRLRLDTGTISVLGYERETAVIRVWNA